MAFSDKKYKTLGDVLLVYPLKHVFIHKFFVQLAPIPPAESLREMVQFTLDNVDYKASEEAICEGLLYPILTAAWKPYTKYFSFWSHKALVYDDFLKGMPDFLFSKRSERSHVIFERPYIAVVEAKLDDFVGGWAQCALEMIAIQKINEDVENPIFGIVTNGDNWEFAKLEKNIFSQYKEKGRIEDLPQIMSILTYILEECKRVYIDNHSG
jgi:hypothetical protein